MIVAKNRLSNSPYSGFIPSMVWANHEMINSRLNSGHGEGRPFLLPEWLE
jgi:hypothetical protein